jgi:SPP1 family predicted phage head-tail adaptor
MANPLSLPAGSLRHKITFLGKTATQDASGNSVTYQPTFTTRAKIEPIRGTDLIRSGQDTAQLYLMITLRYRAGIDSSMRVQALHGTYIIQAVNNILEANRVLELTCIAVGAKG